MEKLEHDINYGQSKMSKAKELADRIKAAKAKHQSELDSIAATMDQYDKVAPDAYQAAHSQAQQQKTEAEDLLSDMRQLSNI